MVVTEADNPWSGASASAADDLLVEAEEPLFGQAAEAGIEPDAAMWQTLLASVEDANPTAPSSSESFAPTRVDVDLLFFQAPVELT